jgi:NAD(P)-dependent dehydrogenase (short-subunit alcohol dehydrogenase family)
MADALADRVAIVTGAGRGIGRGVALLLAQEGARVVVNDPGVEADGSGRSIGPADDVVKEIQAQGGQAVASHDSVDDFAAGEALVKQALDTFGKLDVVVSCHGILRDRMIFNMSEQEWDDVIRVHLKGTFNVVKHACIVMRQQRSGRIITFSSESGLVGNSGQANYGAAKSGIAGFTKVVARDMGRYGVTCNSIAPRAATRMTASVPTAGHAARAAQGISGIAEALSVEAEQAPEDVAPFVAYLASDGASNVNGQIFLVYGNTVSLFSQPRLQVTLNKPEGYWTAEELRRLMPEVVLKGVVNPAPAQGPRG